MSLDHRLRRTHRHPHRSTRTSAWASNWTSTWTSAWTAARAGIRPRHRHQLESERERRCPTCDGRGIVCVDGARWINCPRCGLGDQD